MSMPRCQPLRRRPKGELTVPSVGHRKAPRASANSGTASTKSTGARGPRVRGPASAARGRSVLAVTRGDEAAAAGITSRWPSRRRTPSFAKLLAETSAPTETPWRGAPRRGRPRAARARPSRLESREADTEAREASGRGHPPNVHGAHLGQRRPFLERPHELVDHLARPLGARPHAAVLEVHDVAGEAQTRGLALGVVAIAHALHASLDEDLGGDGHGGSGWSSVAAPPAGWRRPTGGKKSG